MPGDNSPALGVRKAAHIAKCAHNHHHQQQQQQAQQQQQQQPASEPASAAPSVSPLMPSPVGFALSTVRPTVLCLGSNNEKT